MGGGQSADIGGVRVFKVTAGSPAAEAGLEVFFDFILEINGVKMDPTGQQSFAKVIQDAENGAAKLQVFNTRAHTTREVIVNPRKWAGTGLLGATVRYDVVDPAENHGIRVLEVFPNSPAAHAGLVPFQDFLLGTAQSVFHDIDELVEVVNQAINQRVQVYVYNSDTETVREVAMAPNNEWGGDGYIGCDIGTGLLHRIPAPRRMPGGVAPMSAPVAAPIPGQQWTPPAGVPPPAYPPGMVPPTVPGVVPVPAVLPPGVVLGQTFQGVPQPAMPVPLAVPGLPQAAPQVPMPAVPAVPQAFPAGMPGIAPSGVWPPQAQPSIPMPVPYPGALAGVAPPQAPVPMPVPVPAPVPVPLAAPAAALPFVPQVPASALVPVPVPVPAPVLAPVPAVAAAVQPSMYPPPVSQSEELAALQARIAQLGAGKPPVVPVPMPQQAAAAPQLPLQQMAHSPVPGSPSPCASPTSPETPATGIAGGLQAPPCTPLHASDAHAPTDLSHAMNSAAFATGPAAVPQSPLTDGAALL